MSAQHEAYKFQNNGDAMADLVRRKGVHLEACPTSSYLTGGFAPRTRPWSDHPLRHYCRLGLCCGINTDDPLMENVTLSSEWRRCVDEIGLSPAQLSAMSRQAVDAAFCSLAEKVALKARVAAFDVCVPCRE